MNIRNMCMMKSAGEQKWKTEAKIYLEKPC
jgi:hypothetical protein